VVDEAFSSSRCAVVTDAGCDMAPELLEQLGVRCCSADPSADELAGIYRQLLEQGANEVVSVHGAAAFKAADKASCMVEGTVAAVDARFMSAGLALLVERSAHAAARGLSAAQIASLVDELSEAMEMYVVLDFRAPFQRTGSLVDRLSYLRRRALAVRCLMRHDAHGSTLLASSVDLTDLTGRVAHALGARARTEGALCYTNACNNAFDLYKLEKPFDTNEFVSHRLATFMPAPALAGYAGPSALAVAAVPERVFGGHETALFDAIQND